MSDEIAEFLRRAAQRRAELAQQQAESQRRAAQQYAPSPFQQTPVPRVMPVVVEAEVLEDDEEDEPVSLQPAMSKMSQQVARNLDTRAFAQRADRLGDATEQRDERMEAHLHQAFDHRMGNISAGTQSITAAITPDNDDEMKGRTQVSHPILSMLRQPQSVRNAIILSELLQRPEGNW